MGWAKARGTRRALSLLRGTRLRVGLLALGAGAVVPLAGLVITAALLDLPRELEQPGASLHLLDRTGQTLARVRDEQGDLLRPVTLDEVSPWLVPALLAAEDTRFHSHPGVDPLAIARALFDAVRHGRIVSGASTLTQQLARSLFERPRTFAGKWREMALALRIEAELDKTEILEAYLNRIDFGPRLSGVGAASQHYFDKPAQALSLAEAAALVAVVRGPSRYDPARSPERLRQRRDHILARMQRLGWADGASVARARRAPVRLHRGRVAPGAFHFVRAAAQGRFGPQGASGRVTSTLDAALQAEVETALRRYSARLPERRASAAAAVIVENASAAVRAYVGSPDYHAPAALGQNDGAFALRQPGSALKPFVYALALRDLGLHAASILPDLERRFSSPDGDFIPQNYDRRFHGPVRLSQALAASLNVPAATLAERLGPERVVQLFRRLGFRHLDPSGEHYGAGIALGVAEVQLVELAAAYRALAVGGEYAPLRYLESEPRAQPERVLSAALARQIADILADPRERAAGFGREGPLEFDVPVAVKTGTSKGNRDNWTVGFTPDVTVAVWVGNFDGSPMLRSSGASGAGPLFHELMEAARRALEKPRPAYRAAEPEPVQRSICAASGELAGPACPHALPQRFWTRSVPTQACSWHHPSLKLLPPRYAAWAQESGPTAASNISTLSTLGSAAASRSSPSSPPASGPSSPPPPKITSPRPSARFVIDPNVSRDQQQLLFSVRAAAGEPARFELDGELLCQINIPAKCAWTLQRGEHRLVVRGANGADSVRFSVE